MQSLAEIHAERLAWHQGSWTSIEVLVRSEARLGEGWEGRPADFDRTDSHYIETALGQRLLDSHSFKGGEVRYRSTHSFDGSRGLSIAHRAGDPDAQKQVIVQKHFSADDRVAQSDRPVPLYYYWVGREPLRETLAKALFIGEQQVAGRDCDGFLFPQSGGPGYLLDRVYYLDKATSIPLQVEYYLDEQQREQDRPIQVWTAEEIGEVQGYPVVMWSTQTRYTDDGREIQTVSTFVVESMAFNKDFPSSTFRPEIQPDAVVFDTIANERPYRASESAEQAGQAPKATTAVPNPLRAERPPRWTSYAAPTSFGLGLAVLTVGLIVWRRRGS